MKSFRLLACLLFAATPLALPALSSIDGRIETAARHSYNFRIVLEGRVRISVYQGQATLFGYVSDEEAKALAQGTVEQLPEVTGITNNIVVSPSFPVRSDSWITSRIRHRLLVQASVSAATTVVSVYHGVATLGGTAPSSALRDLAALYAGDVDGVKSVTNNITVTSRPAAEDPIDDASVSSLVKLALNAGRPGDTVPPAVTTAAGVVRVTGEAASEADKTLVTRLARDVRGAVSVINDMTVKG